ncbi:MAG TPA: alpha/beta fold hydrolase [Bryobacteraceae bacterium]|nr:alpha/beta fold hydrolase [Bryobacteraceae bacterium]
METIVQDGIRGFLHAAEGGSRGGLVLTHGAGANCQTALLVAVSEAFAKQGFAVLRCDLAFRQRRPHGPPSPSTAAADRGGLRTAVSFLRARGAGPVVLGGHSYGGRQATMLAAEEPAVAEALLLLSYPLHPPDKPAQLRTAHFPQLRTPALFVSGTKDPFGSPDELREALALVPGRHELRLIENAGHDLKRPAFDWGAVVAEVIGMISDS